MGDPATDGNIRARVLELLEWPLVERELESRCATAGGKRASRALVPLGAEGARARMAKIGALRELRDRGEVPDFSGAGDPEETLARADRGAVLSLEELFALREFTAASSRAARFLRAFGDEFPALEPEYRAFDPLKEIGTLLRESINDAGDISESRYPALGRLRNELAAARSEIEKRIGALVHSPAMAKAVQEKTWTSRNDRYVILVKATHRGRVRGTVHDLSASGSTCYVEPEEIIPLNNRALIAARDIRAELLRILAALSGEVRAHVPALSANFEALSRLDLLAAASRLSADTGGAGPAVEDGPVLDLRAARHPLLTLMSGGAVVPNDVRLDAERRCMVISGANTGGKTVLLKTIGLCALMASYGLHIPASPDSRVGVFHTIMADIGDDQSLSRSLSSFSGQIVVLSDMLAHARPGALVIIDEIVTGTNPAQGAALARSILEGLADTGCHVIATTHYGELKELSASDPRFRNASVSFDADTLTPSYRLVEGLPGSSHAVEIAARYGLPAAVIERARGLLDERGTSVEALIEGVREKERELVERELRAAERERALEEKRAALDGRELRIAREAQELARREGQGFLDTLDEHRRAVSERIASLQGAGLREAGDIQKDLIAREEAVRAALRRDDERRYAGRFSRADAGTLAAGDRVFIPSLECEGTAESVDAERGTVVVLLGGSIRSTFTLDGVLRSSRRPAQKKNQPAKKPAREPRAEGPADQGAGITMQTAFNTIDLRGMRADEALSAMESAMDRMGRSGIDVAIVIHGHGTGALKQAVRENLRTSPYSEGFRPGESGEGGDGVTVVTLRR